MVLKLYFNEFATSPKRVLLVCEEYGIAHETVRLDVATGEHKNAESLARNPWGQVPVMDDDGFILWESRTIARYLASKHRASAPQDNPLVPPASDLKAVARFEQAIDTEIAQYNPPMVGLIHVFYNSMFTGAKLDEAKVTELRATVEEKLKVYDVILGKQKYLAGDEVTLADLFHLPEGQIITEQLKLDVFEGKPNVQRWWKDISSRPSWQKVKMPL